MTIRRASFLLVRAGLRFLGVRPVTAVLVIGHMRSGSTLLSHILLTNPAIVGCGERNAEYRTGEDLDKLEIFSRLAQRAPFRGVRYAVDQINHDRFTPNPALLRDPRVRCLFLVREPGPTIQSILSLTRKFYEPWSIERAAQYYASRLDTIARLASTLEDRCVSLTYSELVHQTPAVLRKLETFLGLKEPLREEYAIRKFTGRRGDPSEKIFSGRIVRSIPASPTIEIPAGESNRVREAYEAWMAALRPGREARPTP